jgi:hypothetical protein
MTFWKRILKHCNDHRPTGYNAPSNRSLETKWGLIKYNVAKFCGVYNLVFMLNESGTFSQACGKCRFYTTRLSSCYLPCQTRTHSPTLPVSTSIYAVRKRCQSSDGALLRKKRRRQAPRRRRRNWLQRELLKLKLKLPLTIASPRPHSSLG